jgi:hypothetical protein
MPLIYTPDHVGSGQFGTCGACGLQPSPEGHDGCLGTLPDTNIMNACCGHGRSDMAYIQYWVGERIEGDMAIEEMKRLVED